MCSLPVELNIVQLMVAKLCCVGPQAISVILTHREEGKLNAGAADYVRGLPNEASGSSNRPGVRISLNGSHAPSGVEPMMKSLAINQKSPAKTSSPHPVPRHLIACRDRSALGHPAEGSSSRDSLEICKATLVVCPVVAMIQWKAEIARYCVAGSVKVLVYHGVWLACFLSPMPHLFQTPSLYLISSIVSYSLVCCDSRNMPHLSSTNDGVTMQSIVVSGTVDNYCTDSTSSGHLQARDAAA